MEMHTRHRINITQRVIKKNLPNGKTIFNGRSKKAKACTNHVRAAI